MAEREVTEDEFFAELGPKNVHPRPEGPFPYTSYWETPDRRLLGKSVSTRCETGLPTRYFLCEAPE